MLDTTPRKLADRPPDLDLETWRCSGCRRILAKVRLEAGSVVEIKCSSCNRYSVLERARDRTATS